MTSYDSLIQMRSKNVPYILHGLAARAALYLPAEPEVDGVLQAFKELCLWGCNDHKDDDLSVLDTRLRSFSKADPGPIGRSKVQRLASIVILRAVEAVYWKEYDEYDECTVWTGVTVCARALAALDFEVHKMSPHEPFKVTKTRSENYVHRLLLSLGCPPEHARVEHSTDL
jgi:hypothetical protein